MSKFKYHYKMVLSFVHFWAYWQRIHDTWLHEFNLFFCYIIWHFTGFAQHEVQPTIFGYTELKAATRDFHPTMKLGEGSFGVVYKVTCLTNNDILKKLIFHIKFCLEKLMSYNLNYWSLFLLTIQYTLVLGR
jgi:hypothetical protein